MRSGRIGAALRRVAAILTIAVGFGVGPAAADYFEIPSGFVATRDAGAPADAEWRPLLTVKPVEGPFSDLSSIQLREVIGTVDDPDTWLKARMTVGSGDAPAVEDLFNSPDSPFADPAFDSIRQALPRISEGLKSLSELPLSFCQGPEAAYNASGELSELYCVYHLGPLRQYAVLRLQEVGGHWYYTEIRAANERRLRHLIAISNSFRVEH